MEQTKRIYGFDAIKHARETHTSLSKHTDPVEPARDGLTPDEALEVAWVDPMLVYLDVAQR